MTKAIRRTRGKGRGTAPATSTVRRKNMNMDQQKLDRAVAFLGVSSETEAVDHALDILLLQQEAIEGIRRIAGTGGVENYFDDLDE